MKIYKFLRAKRLLFASVFPLRSLKIEHNARTHFRHSYIWKIYLFHFSFWFLKIKKKSLYYVPSSLSFSFHLTEGIICKEKQHFSFWDFNNNWSIRYWFVFNINSTSSFINKYHIVNKTTINNKHFHQIENIPKILIGSRKHGVQF